MCARTHAQANNQLVSGPVILLQTVLASIFASQTSTCLWLCGTQCMRKSSAKAVPRYTFVKRFGCCACSISPKQNKSSAELASVRPMLATRCWAGLLSPQLFTILDGCFAAPESCCLTANVSPIVLGCSGDQPGRTWTFAKVQPLVALNCAVVCPELKGGAQDAAPMNAMQDLTAMSYWSGFLC
jgi:hypothetical protein